MRSVLLSYPKFLVLVQTVKGWVFGGAHGNKKIDTLAHLAPGSPLVTSGPGSQP